MPAGPRCWTSSASGPTAPRSCITAAGDNPDRLVDEASFAALCGVSPVEQSSGKTQRRRLNRGGHRQANAALYRIVQTRIRWDECTQEYLRRRTAGGHVQARDHPVSEAVCRPRALPGTSSPEPPTRSLL
ncbi:transposase, partial [Streptomyces sp. NPDC006356]